MLGFLPGAVTARARVRHDLSKLVKKVCGICGYFQLYNVPFRLLPLFHYAEWKRIWETGGLPEGTSIFDLMAAAGQTWYVHDSGKNDDGKLADLHLAISQGAMSLAYISLGKLDALVHAEGTQSARVSGLLSWYDTQIRELMESARRTYGDVRLYVFTDHGMHDIHTGYDLQKMSRPSDSASGRTTWHSMTPPWGAFGPELRKSKPGWSPFSATIRWAVSSPTRNSKTSVYFPDAQYGDLIFLMNSGVQIAPSFMGRKAIAGMHGFHPSDPDSKAMICSNQPLPDSLTRIQQIFGLMCDVTGIEAPPGRATS